jgi:hypothetical protein
MQRGSGCSFAWTPRKLVRVVPPNCPLTCWSVLPWNCCFLPRAPTRVVPIAERTEIAGGCACVSIWTLSCRCDCLVTVGACEKRVVATAGSVKAGPPSYGRTRACGVGSVRSTEPLRPSLIAMAPIGMAAGQRAAPAATAPSATFSA